MIAININNIKKYIIFTLAIFFACVSEGENKKNIVAQVDLAYISNAELEASLPTGVTSDSKVALKRKIMEKWIEDEILYQTALKDGLTLNEIEKFMVKNYEKRLLIEKYLQKYININYRVLDQEIEDYYDKHKQEFIWNDDYVHIVHLIMENEDRTIDSEIRKSKDLINVIKNNFFDQQSTEERPIGDLGYIKLKELPAALQSRIKTTKTGSIRGPIKTDFGVHYYQLLDIQKAGTVKDLELVKDEIILRIKMQKRRAEIGKLKQDLRPNFSIQTDLSNLTQSQ